MASTHRTKTLWDRVKDSTDSFDAASVIRAFPWLVQRDQDCIISTDADGMLCGLVMCHSLGWRIRGFYDTKVLVHDAGVNPRNCVFLDVEIFRKDVRSIGQHMLLYNKNDLPRSWSGFDQCFSINNFRQRQEGKTAGSIDALHDYQLKYPLGTIHFLVSALHGAIGTPVTERAAETMFFADGTIHNVFGYTENSHGWLKYLGVELPDHPFHDLFLRKDHSVHSLMTRMIDFWEARNQFNTKGSRGDKIVLSTGKGSPKNLISDGRSTFTVDAETLKRAEGFLRLVADRTGWLYLPDAWAWRNLRVQQLRKDRFERLSGSTFNDLLAKSPVSWAITGTKTIQYTLGEIL